MMRYLWWIDSRFSGKDWQIRPPWPAWAGELVILVSWGAGRSDGDGRAPGNPRPGLDLESGPAGSRSRGQERMVDRIMSELYFRPAIRSDVPAIVAMLANDPLGARREDFRDPLPGSYYDAFEAIDADDNNELIVVERDGAVIGVLQLTFIPYLTYRGGWRGLIEGVRVAASERGAGVGRQLFEWAIERARERGCHLVQLTSDKQRPDAIRFYEGLGFRASHEGMKLHFEPGS